VADIPKIGQRVTVTEGFDKGRSGDVREIIGDEAIVALDYRYEGTRVPIKDLIWRKPEPPEVAK
jgi:ribosomal protein L24